MIRSLRPFGGGIFLAREASMMSSTCVRVRTLRSQRAKETTNLDWSTIDRNTVAFGHSLGRTLGTDEDDVCNTTAGSSRSIRKFDSLDWSYHLDKVLLLIQGLVSDQNIVCVWNRVNLDVGARYEGKGSHSEDEDASNSKRTATASEQ